MTEPASPPTDVLRTGAAGGMVIRGGVLRGGGYVVGILLGAATSVFLLRALGVDNFGRYATVGALLGIVSTVTDAGLTAVGSRELAVAGADDRERLLENLVALRIALTAAGVAGAALFAWAVGYDRTMIAGTLLAGTGLLLVNAQATMMMPLSIELRLGTITSFEVLRQALTLVGVAVLALAGASLLPYFVVQVLVGAALLAATPLVLRSARGLLPAVHRPTAVRLVRETLPMAAAVTMNVLYFRLLLVLVSLLTAAAETGLFATSFRIIEMLVGIPTLVLSVALPLLAVAGTDDLERLRYGLQRMTEVAVVVSAFLALATAALAAPVIRLLAGPDYSGAAGILQIQAWSLVGVFLAQVLALGLLSLRRQRALALANAVAVLVVVVLGLALVPPYGGKGAAVAGVAAEAALALALLVALARVGRELMPTLGFSWRPLLALVIGGAVLLLPGLGPWIQGLLAAAVYCAAAVALRAVPHEVWLALGRRT